MNVYLNSCIDIVRYFLGLYISLMMGYIVVVIVAGGEMVHGLKWSLFLFIVFGGAGVISSYQTETLVRTEWILISMGDRSKRKVCALQKIWTTLT